MQTQVDTYSDREKSYVENQLVNKTTQFSSVTK